MSAAIKCDGCRKFEDAPGRTDHMREPLPPGWVYVALGRPGASTAEQHWEVCSLACAVLVVARLAESGPE